jgi:hypothetical protein
MFAFPPSWWRSCHCDPLVLCRFWKILMMVSVRLNRRCEDLQGFGLLWYYRRWNVDYSGRRRLQLRRIDIHLHTSGNLQPIATSHRDPPPHYGYLQWYRSKTSGPRCTEIYRCCSVVFSCSLLPKPPAPLDTDPAPFYAGRSPCRHKCTSRANLSGSPSITSCRWHSIGASMHLLWKLECCELSLSFRYCILWSMLRGKILPSIENPMELLASVFATKNVALESENPMLWVASKFADSFKEFVGVVLFENPMYLVEEN